MLHFNAKSSGHHSTRAEDEAYKVLILDASTKDIVKLIGRFKANGETKDQVLDLTRAEFNQIGEACGSNQKLKEDHDKDINAAKGKTVRK